MFKFRSIVSTWTGKVAVGLLLFLYGSALLAPFLAPNDPYENHPNARFHPPMYLVWAHKTLCYPIYKLSEDGFHYIKTGSYCPIRWWVPCEPYRLLGCFPCQHRLWSGEKEAPFFPLGSDALGRDYLARLLFGGRISLFLGIFGVLITLGIGCFAGCLAGFLGGLWDSTLMWLIEFLIALPNMYILLALYTSLGLYFHPTTTYILVLVLLASIRWTKIARVVRGLIASLKDAAFIQASQAMGLSTFQLITRHFIPNISSYLLTSATLYIPSFISYESALSFLGIGLQEPTPSWGLMLKYAQDHLFVFTEGLWWLLLPGLGIFLTIFTFNLLGDIFRDHLDPMLKRRKS